MSTELKLNSGMNPSGAVDNRPPAPPATLQGYQSMVLCQRRCLSLRPPPAEPRTADRVESALRGGKPVPPAEPLPASTECKRGGKQTKPNLEINAINRVRTRIGAGKTTNVCPYLKTRKNIVNLQENPGPGGQDYRLLQWTRKQRKMSA